MLHPISIRIDELNKGTPPRYSLSRPPFRRKKYQNDKTRHSTLCRQIICATRFTTACRLTLDWQLPIGRNVFFYTSSVFPLFSPLSSIPPPPSPPLPFPAAPRAVAASWSTLVSARRTEGQQWHAPPGDCRAEEIREYDI